MKLKFDPNLEYQIEAIRSVTDLFEGLPQGHGELTIDFGKIDGSFLPGISNNQTLSSEQLFRNLASIQSRNSELPKSNRLIEEGSSYQFPNFSVEMETGTGKTYVYLRTLFELNKLYGFKKFIIVVPSVAIREGVTSSIRAMKEHFKEMYDNVPFDSFVYQSKDLSRVRQFAFNNTIQVMVINIQAFQKDVGDNVDYTELSSSEIKKLNIIHQEQDKMGGRRPIEYIQQANPIVIIDEPQSVDNTQKSQRAIASLNPLFALRYSATHANPYNLLYKLDPIRAYRMRLVKQIEVIDATDGRNFNKTTVRLDEVGYWPKSSKVPQAKITIFEDTPNGPREKRLKVRQGTDLAKQTNRSDYEGYRVTNISAESGNEYIEFQNSRKVELFYEADGMGDERMKNQLRQTIEEHFAKEKKLRDKGIKVLSLFFIDHVKNYRQFDENGNCQKGKLALWFEELYSEINNKYNGLLPHAADLVHDGYFAVDTKKGKVIEELDTNGVTAKDDDAYALIMKDKERLLNIQEPLRFIFSHSALREGWDNPNVFQICTLREMGTDRQRRQTIGRGLRLPVNQHGERIDDNQINRLTVIANESFEDFARGLQADMYPNGIAELPLRYVENARERKKLSYNKRIELNHDFKILWERISQKTRYSIEFQTEDLVNLAIKKIKKMPEITEIQIKTSKRGLNIQESGIEGGQIFNVGAYQVSNLQLLPDILAFFQRETKLTRKTLVRILKQAGNLEYFVINPAMFMAEVAKCINKAMHELIIDGIKYEPIAGKMYDMRLFEQKEIQSYLSRLYEVKRADKKTPYDYIEYESGIEKEVAEFLDDSDKVKFFCKLPSWFKVGTPLGSYNPDWAVVIENDEKLYLVRESKSTHDREKRRELENAKLDCGKAHFEALGVNFKVATSIHEVLQK